MNGPASTVKRTLPPLAVIVATYLALCLAYTTLVPIWEAPDEPAHFLRVLDNAHRIGLSHAGAPPTPWLLPPVAAGPASGRRRIGFTIPTDRPDRGTDPQTAVRTANPLYQLNLADRKWKKEAIVRNYEQNQMPLYYWAAAPLLSGLDSRHLPPFFFNRGYGRQLRHMFHHGLDYRSPFLAGTVRVHLLRLLSVLCGLLSAVLLARILPEALGNDGDAAAAGLVMGLLIPQFIFITSVVNNDPFAVLFCTGGIMAALRLITGPTHGPGVVPALLTSLALLAGIASKVSAAFLLLPATYAVIVATVRRDNARDRLRLLAAYLLPLSAAFLVLALWGTHLLGSQWAQHLAVRSSLIREDVLGYDSMLYTLRTFYDSYWFRMGWMRLFPPHGGVILFRILTILLCAALLRGLYLWWKKRLGVRGDVLTFFILAVGTLVLFMIKNSLFSRQPQGRFLFPAVAGTAFFWGLLLTKLAPRRLKRWVPSMLFAAMVLVNVGGLVMTVVPTYSPRDTGLPLAYLTESEGGVYLQFDEGFVPTAWDGPIYLLRSVGAVRLHSRMEGDSVVDMHLPLKWNRKPQSPGALVMEVWSPAGMLAELRLEESAGEYRLEGLPLRSGENSLAFRIRNGEQRFGILFERPDIRLSNSPALAPVPLHTAPDSGSGVSGSDADPAS